MMTDGLTRDALVIIHLALLITAREEAECENAFTMTISLASLGVSATSILSVQSTGLNVHARD